MGWLSVVICAIPAILLYRLGPFGIFVVALLNVIANLWSFGVMHNYAVEASAGRIRRLRRSLRAEGRFDAHAKELIDRVPAALDLEAIPNWLTTMNMVTAAFGVGLLIFSVVRIVRG